MEALDEEITKLNAEIADYWVEYKAASSEARKDKLLDTITSRSRNLDRFLDEKAARRAAAIAGIKSLIDVLLFHLNLIR